jgi:predicted small secreted protein
MTRKAGSILVLVAVALSLAACGGGGGKSSTPAAETTTAATTTEAVTTTEAATTVEAATTATTEAAGTTTVAAPPPPPPAVSGIANADCRRLADVSTKLSQALSGTGGTDIQKTAKFLQDFANQAPSDIRADFKAIADAYSKIADALKGVDLTKQQDPQTLAKLQKLATEIDQAKLTKASSNISAWVQKNCTNG